MRRTGIRSFALAAVALFGAASAWAQDYVVSSVTGQYVTPPTSGTNNLISQTKGRDDAAFAITTLPFPIFYFGEFYSSMSVCTNGYVQFGTGSNPGTTTKFATNFPLSGATDGICAVAWDDLDGQALAASLVVFTDGEAPNRRIIVDWSSWQQALNTGSLSFQVQFSEGSGRIQMAYGSGWSGQTRPKAVGIDAVSPDNRYVTPDGSTLFYNTPTSQPANDWRFDPRITRFNGRLLYDRFVVDASGIGNTSDQSVPLAGLRVEVRSAGGKTLASGVTSSDGDFAVQGQALDGTASGTVVVVAQGDNCTVRTSAGAAPYATAVATSVPFGSDQTFGTLTLGDGNDAGGSARAPLHAALTVEALAAWCAARTADTIEPIDVLYDTTSAATTGYAPAGADPAALRVGAASSNPDPWDSHVLRKAYGRHVLASIARASSTAVDTAFDKATDAENAFAEAFGYYLDAAMTGSASWFDGTSGSAATQISLESPTLVTARGPAVSGWVTAALHDLVDGANEAWDVYDGAGGGLDQVFQTVDSIEEPPTAVLFYEAWGGLGFAGGALARDFIHHGLLGDDSDEPNATSADRRVLPQWGFARTGRVLNLYDEDWYEVTLPAATNQVTVDVVYDRGATDAVVDLEVYSSTGSHLADGTFSGAGAPLRATLGPRQPGAFRVRVSHVSGDRVDAYALQVFSELTMSADAFRPWTVGRPYDVPVAVQGGIGPYTLTVEAPFVKPDGLILNSGTLRVTGAPTVAGTYDFSLTTRDAATPNNLASVAQHFVVNPELTFTLGEFLAMPLGKSLDRAGAYSGGTTPLTFTPTAGGLPDGVSLAPGEFRFVGTPTTPGSTSFTLQGVDVAGSGDTSQTTAVVCVPFGAADLAVGPAACGWWFDAALGSKVTIAIKTGKKQPKRALRVVVVGPDGTTETPATVKPKTGKASVSFVAPASGRFYVVAVGATGEASQLVASGKVLLAKTGKGGSGEDPFQPGTDLPVEIGALQGSALTFSIKPDKSGILVRLPYLVSPSGATVALSQADVTEKKGVTIFSRTLDAAGTWTIVLGARPGPAGSFTYSYKVAHPKGAAYSAD